MLTGSHDTDYPFLLDSRFTGLRDTYLGLRSFDRGDGAFMAVETVAKKLDVSESTVHRHIRKLKGLGVIQVQKRFRKGRQQTNLYRFPTPDWWIDPGVEPGPTEGCHPENGDTLLVVPTSEDVDAEEEHRSRASDLDVGPSQHIQSRRYLPGVKIHPPWTSLPRRTLFLQHQDHIALQRVRRNRALTSDDLQALEQMLLDSGAGDTATIDQAKEESHGLGLFIRSLVGLDREAALEAFGTYLDGTKFTADQIRFVNLIVNELTANGVMEPARLYESPYTDHTPGPESVFAEADVDYIVEILNTVKANALPTDGAA